jgi:hypothetical protein
MKNYHYTVYQIIGHCRVWAYESIHKVNVDKYVYDRPYKMFTIEKTLFPAPQSV